MKGSGEGSGGTLSSSWYEQSARTRSLSANGAAQAGATREAASCCNRWAVSSSLPTAEQKSCNSCTSVSHSCAPGTTMGAGGSVADVVTPSLTGRVVPSGGVSVVVGASADEAAVLARGDRGGEISTMARSPVVYLDICVRNASIRSTNWLDSL